MGLSEGGAEAEGATAGGGASVKVLLLYDQVGCLEAEEGLRLMEGLRPKDPHHITP